MSGSKVEFVEMPAHRAAVSSSGRLAWPAAVAVISALSVGGWVLVFKLAGGLIGV